MLDSDRTFKIKVRSDWTIFEILFALAVIAQYLQNCKHHEVDQDYSKKLL